MIETLPRHVLYQNKNGIFFKKKFINSVNKYCLENQFAVDTYAPCNCHNNITILDTEEDIDLSYFDHTAEYLKIITEPVIEKYINGKVTLSIKILCSKCGSSKNFLLPQFIDGVKLLQSEYIVINNSIDKYEGNVTLIPENKNPIVKHNNKDNIIKFKKKENS